MDKTPKDNDMDYAFEVYRYYLALRLHFTTEKYDVIKQQGRVKASRQAFHKRTDLFAIKKVAESYSEKEIVDFLVANFTSGDRWGGVFDTEAKERYLSWKKRIESMSYTFEKEVSRVNTFCLKKDIDFSDALHTVNSQHPYIIKMYLRGDVSIETLVILNKLLNFVPDLDNSLTGDLVWPDLSRIIKKYEPFLTFSKEKYGRILRRATGLDEK
jgi:hypothetical protein